MTQPRGIIRSTELPTYDLGSQHPFARNRQAAFFDLLERMHLVNDLGQPPRFVPIKPSTATDEELAAAHDPAYIRMVQAISVPAPSREILSQAYGFGFGTSDNPIAPGQHQAAAAVVGATTACVEAVLSGQVRHAFHSSGGLHHARRNAAAGFCVYNDLVAGIQAARRAGAARVLYVDFDVHHGDGVEFAFERDPNVMTVSFHETPDTLYPGTGRIEDVGKGDAIGSVVNVPLAPATGDDSWLHAVQTILPTAACSFGPDMIISQHGCDAHFEDPLANLDLTTRPMFQAASLTRQLADELCQGRWVATGGGGYQPLRVIPRAWTLVWLAMLDRQPPERVDSEWLAHWNSQADQSLPELFFDAPRRQDQHAADDNARTVSRLMQRL